MNIWLNGRFCESDESSLDMNDRGYQFGDGVYEVIAVHQGNLIFLDEHLDRFERSASEIQIKIPYARSTVVEALERLISVNDFQEGIVYMQLTRGVAKRNHSYSGQPLQPQLFAYTNEASLTHLKSGVVAITTEDLRWLRCDIKSLNLLPNVIAKEKAHQNRAFEAILHRGQTVTEGASSNVFIVKLDTIKTHPANNFILNGITRMKTVILSQVKSPNRGSFLFSRRIKASR